MTSKALIPLQFSSFAKIGFFTFSLIIGGCGGGGGSSPAPYVPPAGGSGSDSDWVAGQYDDWRETSMRNICESPRTTGGYSDTQGTVTDENNWIRSYSNDTYLWYSELPDIDPGTVSSAETYFDLMRTDGLSPTGNAKDQFHYSQNTEEYNQYYSGVSAGYGVRFFLIESSPPRKIIVGYNEPNGPAANNNLSRGAEIVSVDGEAIIDSNDVDTLNAALFPETVGESHTFVVRDLNATEDRSFTMTSAQTTTVPVKNTATFDVAGTKVGYLTFKFTLNQLRLS